MSRLCHPKYHNKTYLEYVEEEDDSWIETTIVSRYKQVFQKRLIKKLRDLGWWKKIFFLEKLTFFLLYCVWAKKTWDPFLGIKKNPEGYSVLFRSKVQRILPLWYLISPHLKYFPLFAFIKDLQGLPEWIFFFLKKEKGGEFFPERFFFIQFRWFYLRAARFLPK